MTGRYLAVAVCGGSCFIDMYATQPLLPGLRAAFGASEAVVGATITATTFGCAFAAPFVGLLADRLGRKRVIVASMVLLALATFGAATANSIASLMVWRVAQGIMMPGVFAVLLAYMAEEFPLETLGRAVSMYATGNIVGGFLGRYVSAIVSGRSSWNMAFVVLGILTLIGVVVTAFALPPSTKFVRSASLGSSGRAIGEFLRNQEVLTTYILGGITLFTNVATFTFVTFYLAAPPFSLSALALGNVFCVYLMALVATPFGGRMIDRFGNRATSLVAIAISAFGVLLTLVANLPMVIIGITIMSNAVFVMQTSSQGYLGRIVTTNRSTASAVYFTFYYIFGGLGAVIPAIAWTHGGWTATVALIVVVQLLIGALVFFGWKKPVYTAAVPAV